MALYFCDWGGYFCSIMRSGPIFLEGNSRHPWIGAGPTQKIHYVTLNSFLPLILVQPLLFFRNFCSHTIYNPVNREAKQSRWLVSDWVFKKHTSSPSAPAAILKETKKQNQHFLAIFAYIWVSMHKRAVKRPIKELYYFVENFQNCIICFQFVFLGLMVQKYSLFKELKISFSGNLQYF